MARQIKNDISTTIFTSNCVYGTRNEGNDFGLVGQLTSYVNQLDFHMLQSDIGRIVVTKFDKSCITIGATEVSEPISLKLSHEDRLESAMLYTKGPKLVGVIMKLKSGRELKAFVKDSNPSNSQEHRVEVGTGELIGVFGDAATYVESLGLAMRKRR